MTPRSAAKTMLQIWNAFNGRRFAEGLRGQSSEASVAPGSTPNDLERYFDAVTEGPGIWKWRHYFDVYHRHFQRFVGCEVHVVEIGIYSGGSLPMWRHYFGPKSHIYGIDIEDACKQYAGEGVEVFIGDQADRSFWARFKEQVPRVDIVIDDGGHTSHQQIVTLEEMLPHIRSGGVYLCEDIQGVHNRFGAYLGGLAQALNGWSPLDHVSSETNAFQRHIASIHLYPFCAVLEKTSAAIAQFDAPKHGTQWQPFL